MNNALAYWIATIALGCTSCTVANPKVEHGSSVLSDAAKRETRKRQAEYKPDNSQKTAEHAYIDIAMKILTTAPAYIQKTKGLYDAVVKNGGSSYGITIEGSPNPKEDGALSLSKTYDFNLHETYADHMPTIARFTFDPRQGQLYEYQTASDSLVSIEFDRSLLVLFERSCVQKL